MLNDQELADRRLLIAESSDLRELLIRLDARALPVLLVVGALAVAGITVWRSTVWLGRGRV